MEYSMLVVDDSMITRKMVIKNIEMAGIATKTILEAGNGLEALEILKTNHIDMVFADIRMPQMDGLQMVEKMAADQTLSKIPVIILSADHNKERYNRLTELGISSFIKKPFRPEHFSTVVPAAIFSQKKSLSPTEEGINREAELSSEKLQQIVSDTLEDAAFIFCEPVNSDDTLTEQDVLMAVLPFRSSKLLGTLKFLAGIDFCKELACNLLGIDDDDADDADDNDHHNDDDNNESSDRESDALSEIVNILCGQLMRTGIIDSSSSWETGIPEVKVAQNYEIIPEECDTQYDVLLKTDEDQIIKITIILKRLA